MEQRIPTQPASKSIIAKVFYILGSIALLVLILRVGQPIILPLVLAILFAFILAPAVRYVERTRLGRTASALLVTGMSFGILALIMWGVVTQIMVLAKDLPNHESEIKSKLESFHSSESSTVGRLTSMFEGLLASEEKKAAQEGDAATIVVRDSEETDSPLATAAHLLLPILSPLAGSLIIVVLVIFFLIRLEDVRYRIISLLGDNALTGTTRLMRDAAERVSSYLFNLLLVNAGFGIWIGAGLYLIGVPYAPLWGFLTFSLRFVPYIGTMASIVLPLLVSIATSTGWSEPLWLIGFFLVSEVILAYVIEPILFGKSTGLTPLALLVAAIFWTWVWGPVGLLLSAPLTVCLVVMGQHIPHLRSLKVLLAELPTVDSRLQYFQRLVAGDVEGGNQVALIYAKTNGTAKTYDDVIIPALRWARRERDRDTLAPEEEREIFNATQNTLLKLEDLRELDRAMEEQAPKAPIDYHFYNYPVHHQSEELIIGMLANTMSSGFRTTAGSSKKLPSSALTEIENSNPDLVILTVIPPGGLPQTSYMCEEIRERRPGTPIIVMYLDEVEGYDELLVKLRSQGASYLTTSLAQTQHQIEMLRKDAQEIAEKNHPKLTNAQL